MERRSFLKNSSLISLPILLGGMPVSAIEKSSLFTMVNGNSDRVLVLIQLNGGNDGLNTMIPMDQYDRLFEVRQNLIVPEAELLDIGSDNAFHPAWAEMRELYTEDRLAVVQSVGYPDQNRSHFRSTDIWHTASASDEYLSTGWLGRYLDLTVDNFPAAYPSDECPDPFAMTLGAVVSETCQGQGANYSFVVNNPENLTQLVEFEGGPDVSGCYGVELTFVRETVRQANAYADSVKDRYEAGANLATYPETRLATQLKTVAKLIAGGSQTKIYVVSIGGFDTHAYQVDTPNAPANTRFHSELLAEVSGAIKAFQEDIDAQGNGERVLGMTFSEFGRRIRSNFSAGTDHGDAAPLFVFGNCVNPGILGSNPEISTDVSGDEGVPMQYDFRSIYGSILMDWFEMEEADVRSTLFEDFQHIPILRLCSSTSTKEEVVQDMYVNIFPNPTPDIALVDFRSAGGTVHISVLNTIGHVVDVVMNKSIGRGSHTVPIDLSRYGAGIYFVRISEGSAAVTRRVVKP